jgi:hypothetical protein
MMTPLELQPAGLGTRIAICVLVVLACGAEAAQAQERLGAVRLTADGVPAALRGDPPVAADSVAFTSEVDSFIEFPSRLTEKEAQSNARGLASLTVRQPEASWLVPARCVSDGASICVVLELPAGTSRTLPLAVIASFARSPVVPFVAHRRDRLFFPSANGALRLAPASHQVLRIDDEGVSALTDTPGSSLCTALAPPRTCAPLTVIRVGSTEQTLELEALPGAADAPVPPDVKYAVECADPSWRACLRIPLKATSREIAASVIERLVSVPLRARVEGEPVLAPPPPPAPTAPAPPQPAPRAELKGSAPIYVTIEREGALDPTLRNHQRPLLVPPSRDLVVRNFGSLDVRVEIRIPAVTTAPKKQAGRTVAIVSCEDASFQCVRATVLREETVRIPAAALAVFDSTDATMEVRGIPGLTLTATGYLRIQQDPSLVKRPPPPVAEITVSRAAAPPTDSNPPKSVLELAGDFSANRTADFDSDNDNQEAISRTDPFTGGYTNTLRGKATILLNRTNDALEGMVVFAFQDSVFGGLDGRLLSGAGQPSLVKTSPVTRLDDPVSIERWFFKITPSPNWFLQIGRMLFASAPDNIAGLEAAEGIQLSLTPGTAPGLSVSVGYGIAREGLNGVPDRHERDAEVVAFNGTWDGSKRPNARYPPRINLAWRHAWDRGRDRESDDPSLVFDPAIHPFFGTQRRWTAGFEVAQPLPRDFTARASVYWSRLRLDDVDAIAAKQKGEGHVLRLALVSPASARGTWTVFFLRGSRDDPDTPLLNEGFLGNEQRRFSERNPDAALDTDSVYFHRMANLLQMRAVGSGFVPALGLSNKTYAGASWSWKTAFLPKAQADETQVVNTNPLRDLIWVAKYRAIWQSQLVDASGFAGHEIAVRVTGNGLTGNGAWTPYAGIVYFRRGEAVQDFIAKEGIFQAFIGASLKIPVFSHIGKP